MTRKNKRSKRINRLTLLLLLLASITFYQCNFKVDGPYKFSSSLLKASADSLLTDWHIAAAEANYENYFGAMDSISIFIGTDYTENWTKEEFEAFSKPYFDRGRAWSFSAIDRNIYHNEKGTFLWFDELLQTWMGVCRGSGVIENKNGIMKIKHYVLSVTVPNDTVNAFLKLKQQELDSSFVKSLSFK